MHPELSIVYGSQGTCNPQRGVTAPLGGVRGFSIIILALPAINGLQTVIAGKSRDVDPGVAIEPRARELAIVRSLNSIVIIPPP